jgi:hypothetical protein
MYPRPSDLVRDVFGIPFPVPIYSFGVMAAVAILVGTWLGGSGLTPTQAEIIAVLLIIAGAAGLVATWEGDG